MNSITLINLFSCVLGGISQLGLKVKEDKMYP